MSYSVEEVSFEKIHKPTFLLMCSAYSLFDAVLFHPPAVAAIVAELHRVQLPQDKNLSSFARLRRSFGANLSIKQAAAHIIKASGGDVAKPSISLITRAMYTGFPVTFAGLFVYDLAQMLPYNWAKSQLDSLQETRAIDNQNWSLPSPILAGLFTNSCTAPFSNIPSVLLRQQVQQRCLGQQNSLRFILNERLPRMEGGTARVLFRGIWVSLSTGVPAAAIGWQVYESTKSNLQSAIGSQSVLISVASGGVSGAVGTIVMRPVGVVVSRMQTDTQAHGFSATAKAVLKTEGVGAFYKGLLPRLISAVPRSGLFYSVYQSIITFSKIQE